MKTGSKESGAMLKQSLIGIESIHECTTQYPDAPEALQRKEWITVKMIKLQSASTPTHMKS